MYLVLIFASLFATSQCSNILGVFIYPDTSGHAFAHKILRELSLKGHQVTVITTNPFKDASLTNLTEIYIPDVRKIHLQDLGNCEVVKTIFEFQYASTLKVINNSNVRNLVQDKSLHFDLILKDFLNPFSFGFGYRFNAPVIDISSSSSFNFINDRYANPNHPLLYPDLQVDVDPRKATNWEKTKAVYYFLWSKYHYYHSELPRFDELVKKLFGDDIPYVGDLERNASMFFTNSNPLVKYPRPNVPAVVELLPLEKSPAKPLPKDLKKLLDEAKNGVVYVNLGPKIDNSVLSTIKKALLELPFTVFWKGDPTFGPSNVIARKRFPQKDVLAHPNVKAFVTDGSLHSVEEAIAGRVPMVGIPFGMDQPANVRKMVRLGVAEKLDPTTLTKEQLKKLIVKVAGNKAYKSRIDEIRYILYDAPATGLEKAVWWSEYVIRHKGARHFRSAAVDMHWFQYLLLDVILLLALCVVFFIYLIYKLLGGLMRCVGWKKQKDIKVKTN